MLSRELPLGRVLVVEDDPAICGLISEMLEETRLAAVCVRSDMDAYVALPTLPTFKAVILDINLGSGTTGFDVARFARRVIPEIGVVYISGEASLASVATFGVPGSVFLEKPFSAEQMLGALLPRLSAGV